MIEISPDTAILLYLAATLALLLGAWTLYLYPSKKRRLVLKKQELFVCEYCQFPYLINRIEQINRCPQCNSYNRRCTKAKAGSSHSKK